MKALLFRYNLARVAFSSMVGRLTDRAYLSSAGPLTLATIPEPSLPADDWAIVRTRLCGICGSDTKQVFLDGNFDNPLTALISFPQVLGHEVVGVVEKTGPGVTMLKTGQRVVLNPWLSCAPRGIQPLCDACQRGEPYLCACFKEGRLAPGMHIGNCSSLPGGFGPFLAAHESQLFPIPDGVDFEQAVLADPFSVSLHGILKAPPSPDRIALVFGCGTLGLLSIAILRRCYPETTVVAVARYPHQAEAARKLNAQHVLMDMKPVEIVESIAKIAGVTIHRPWRGLPMLLRGVDVIYDTIGSPQTLETGIRVADPHAHHIVTGVAQPKRFEWTPLYFKEIQVIGSNAFGVETFEGERRHAMQIYLHLLERGRINVTGLVTHRFRLDQYRQAFLTAHHKKKNGSIKVVFNYS